MLTDLELTFLGVGEVPPFHIDAFSIAPRLARAQLFNLPEGVHVHFANSNLVHFSDYRPRSAPTNAYLLDVIQKSPDLEIFEVTYCGLHAASPSLPVPSTRVANTSLRKLYACEGVFLGSLVLPALETISMTPFSDEVPCPPNALSGLRTLLSQSRCSLTQLTMTDAAPDHHLLPFLELVPTLTSLAFAQNHAWPKYYDDIFQALITRMKATAVDDNGKPYHLLLPHLEKLTFSITTEAPQDSNFHCFVNHDFAEMVISRWDTDEPSLSSVSVTFVSPLPWKFPGLLPDDVTNLKRCQMEKLDIDISSRNFDNEGDFYV